MSTGEEVDVDKIINKLLENGGKDAKLLESEIRGLCIKAREIFLEQPMLLELEAPIKICGTLSTIQVTSMDNIQIWLSYLNTQDFRETPTICSLEIMWTEENNLLKLFVLC